MTRTDGGGIFAFVGIEDINEEIVADDSSDEDDNNDNNDNNDDIVDSKTQLIIGRRGKRKSDSALSSKSASLESGYEVKSFRFSSLKVVSMLYNPI